MGRGTSSVSGNITLNGNSIVETPTATTDTLTISGVIAESSAQKSLTKTGAGILVLSSTNTYTGNTNINGGTLRLGLGTALQNSTVNLSTVGATLGFGTLTAATIGGLSGSQDLALVNDAAGAVALTVGNTNAHTTYTGILSGSGSLVKSGNGTLTLGGASSYTGLTTINSGTVVITDPTALGSNVAETRVNTGATLTLETDTAEPIKLNGGGLTTSGGSATASGALTLAGSGIITVFSESTLTLSGVIGESGGAAILAKNGLGTLEFSGANTYTGATNVNDGTLVVSGSGTLGTAAGATAVNAGAKLKLVSANVGAEPVTLAGGTLAASGNSSLSGAVTLASAGTINVGDDSLLNLSGAIGESGGTRNLTKTGAGTLALSGPSNYTGWTTVSEGTLRIDATNALPTSTALGLSASTALVLQQSQTIQRFLGAVSSLSEIIIESGKALTISTPTSANASGGAGNYTGNISGVGALIFDGVNFANPTPGTVLVLSGTNTYTGGTTINAGTLQIGSSFTNGGTTGSITGNVANNGQLIFYRSDNISFGGVISGTGGVSLGLDGVTNPTAGELTLTAASSYSGETRISSGVLRVGTTNALPTTTGVSFGSSFAGMLHVAENQTIKRFTGTNANSQILISATKALTVATPSGTVAGTFAGTIYGDGGLVVNGTDAANPNPATLLTLTGNNVYLGGTTINSGLLALGNGGATGSITGNVNLGTGTAGGLVFNRNNDYTFNGVISGLGGVTQSGSGITTLAGLSANTYQGGTHIQSGALIAGKDNAFGTGAINVNGGVVAVDHGYTIANPLNLTAGVIAGNGTFQGAGALIKSGVTVSPADGGFHTTATLGFTSLTLAGGGSYEWNIFDEQFQSTAAIGTQQVTPWSWDQIAVSGQLTFDATLSSTPFTLKLVSLSDWEQPGMVTGFTNQAQSWTILSAGSTNGTFNASQFVIDRSSFTSNINGTFSLSKTGSSLVLNFTPVPEPSTWAMMISGGAMLMVTMLRRRRRN